MFYSQTFLARKGPLGTVWCAAHLQHRLKKSHYTSTDISSTVDCIMFPEVPMALRMSGHLLLGVVRIYSKKVDYLYQDCNVAIVALKKAFASTEVNLPENATTAKFEAVTLPQTFDLDDFNIDIDIDPNRFLDDHTRSPEDITLQDQICTNSESYVVVTFEDTMFDILQPQNDGSGNNNISPPTTVPSNRIGVTGNVTADEMDTDPIDESNRTEPINEDFNTVPNGDDSPPEIEYLRDREMIPEYNPLINDLLKNTSEQNRSSNRGLNEEEIHAPFEDSTPFQKHSSPFLPPTESPREPSRNNDTLNLSGHMSSDFNVRSSPQVQPPKQNKRKRKNLFDESFVLSNKYMKEALNDCKDISRKKRAIPCTSLGIWKRTKALRKEKVFSEPSLTGLCTDISNLYNKEFISTKPHLIHEREVTPEPTEPSHRFNAETFIVHNGEEIREAREVNSPPGEQMSMEHVNTCVPENETENDVEIEGLRKADGFEGNRIVHFPPGLTPPFRRDESTPSNSPKSIGSDTVGFTEPSAGTSVVHTQDHSAASNTPFTDLDIGRYSLEDIPEIGNTAQTEMQDLCFLEIDHNPPGSQGTQGIDSLPVRTRATAQFLLRQSPIASMSEEQSEDLSLNKILEGKTRKIAARMFFETLVLKTHGLIDVRQEQPYGDISLKPTSMLAKSQL